MKIIAVVLLAVSAFAADNRQGFHWRGLVLPGKMIEIKGINGDVYAEASDGTEVEVVASMVSGRSDPTEVKVEMLTHANGVTVCALYPTSVAATESECSAGETGQSSAENSDVRVNFVVRVPKGVGLVSRTVNGAVAAESLKSDVEAYTVNGKVKISTTGSARARTINGSIEAALLSPMLTKSPQFSTVNGGITLQVPARASATLEADTLNGRILANFPLPRMKSGQRSVRAKLGAGGTTQLRLKTVNGSIQLKRAG